MEQFRFTRQRQLFIIIIGFSLALQLCFPSSGLLAEESKGSAMQGRIGLQLGKMKQNSGLFQLNGYLYTLPADEIFFPSPNPNDTKETFAGIKGVGLFGELPAGVSYQLQYGTLEAAAANGILRVLIKDADQLAHNLDVDYAYMGSFQWETPVEGIKLGGSLYNLRMASNGLNASGFIGYPEEIERIDQFRLHSIRTSVESTKELTGNLKLTAEFIQNKSALVHNDASQKAITGEGYLGGATYQFTDWLELGSYYSIYYADKTDKDGKEWISQGKQAAKAWIKDFAVTSRIDINEKWMLKIEGHILNGLAGVDTIAEEEWVKVAAEMVISF